MNLSIYYKKQTELEAFVRETLGMTKEEFTSEEMIEQRVFAFKVELAEFANEVGWFKYWKQSHQMKQAETLEELADCIHFLTAIGIYRRYTFIQDINPKQWQDVALGHMFEFLMYNDLNSSGQWKVAFEQLICIGLQLGYTLDEIQQAYLDKNQKNIERQKNKY